MKQMASSLSPAPGTWQGSHEGGEGENAGMDGCYKGTWLG